MRWIAVCAMSACLICTPHQSEAGVIEAINKCSRSLKMLIVCVVIERGVEKVLDVALGDLIDYAFGRTKTIQGTETKASATEIADVQANGIAWPGLREFLVSVFSSAKPLDDAQARAAIAASCNAKHSPICAQLGFAAPHPTAHICAKIMTQQDCDASLLCSWKGSYCSHSGRGGMKELLER